MPIRLLTPQGISGLPDEVRRSRTPADRREDARGRIWLLRPRPGGESFTRVEFDASERMLEHGLHDWAFGFGRGKRTLGTTRVRHGERTGAIRISRHLVEANLPEVLRDTILHEIAHALAYRRFGRAAMNHGPAWRAIALEVGAEPRATCQVGPLTPAPYTLECTACGAQVGLYRKPRYAPSRYRHKGCGGTFRRAA